MSFADYFGADERGRPLPVRSVSLAGVRLQLAPLTVHQVFELQAALARFEEEVLALIYYHDRPEIMEQIPLATRIEMFAACVRVLWPAESSEIFERAKVLVASDAGRFTVETDVREILAFYAGEHDWPTIFDELLGVAGIEQANVNGVDTNRVCYRKPKGARLSLPAAHLSATLQGAPHLFAMLHWRVEAYLTEGKAFRELEKKSDPKENQAGGFEGTLEEFSRSFGDWPEAPRPGGAN